PYSTPAFAHILPTLTKKKGAFYMPALTKLAARNELAEKEKNRLQRLLSHIESHQMQRRSGLITQAARLRVLRDEMWADIRHGGGYELFSQYEKVEPDERERRVAKLYKSRDQSYQKVIKQLVELLPKEEQQEATDYVEDDLI